MYKKFLTAYDAVEYLNEHLEDGMIVNVKGKDRYIERNSIGESLINTAKMWLKNFGYKDDIDKYVDEMALNNNIDCLPDEVREKFEIHDCYVQVPLTEEKIKQYSNVDKDKLVKLMISGLENKPLSIKEQIVYEQEYLGNIMYKNPKAPKDMYYVLECKFYKDKTKPYVRRMVKSQFCSLDLIS